MYGTTHQVNALLGFSLGHLRSFDENFHHSLAELWRDFRDPATVLAGSNPVITSNLLLQGLDAHGFCWHKLLYFSFD